MNYLLGIDNGGTFVKAALFDESGKEITSAQRPGKLIVPKAGYSERDLEELWQLNAECVREVVEKSGVLPEEVSALSFSGHGKGLYLVDEDGMPLGNGILSTDNRAAETVRQWQQNGTAEQVRKFTCQDILACQPVSLLAWLKENEPERYQKIGWVFTINDYLRFRLTGVANGDYTNLSGCNLINLQTSVYDRELLALFGLSEIYDKLPPLIYSAQICGTVSALAAEQTGLSPATKVAGGMFDINACGIATGLIDEQGLCMIAGTWAINEFLAKAPNNSAPLNSMYCIPGYYLIEESSPTSSGNLEWIVQNFLGEEQHAAKQQGISVYEIIDEWVAQTNPADSEVIFLPYLNGAPGNSKAKGAFVGLTAYHNKKHLITAVFEGVVFSHLAHLRRLLVHRKRPDCIRLAGGAARSKVWVQMFADATGIPIEVVEAKELGAQGAAMTAGVAAGIYPDFEAAVRQVVRISERVEPRAEYCDIYAKKFVAFETAAKALEHI